MTKIYNTLCSELSCNPVTPDRFTPDDSFISFPGDTGHCYVYALAYRLGVLGRREIMEKKFPSPVSLITKMIKKLRKSDEEDPIWFLLEDMMDSPGGKFILESDPVLDLTPMCCCEYPDYRYDWLLEQISDLIAIKDDVLDTWHIYFNPVGKPTGKYLGYTYSGYFGAKNNKTQPKKKVTITVQPKKKNKQNGSKPKSSAIGQVLKTAGTIAGAYFGSPAIGKSIGAGISRIFGQGDYRVQSNSLMNGGPPSFSPLGSGIRFTHREYLTDILSSTAYTVRNYRLQPNATGTFPWLSQLASSFEQYKFNGCVLYLNTTSGNAVSSTNNALGVWGVTTVYDPSKPPLASKIQAEEYNGCTAGVPSTSILHPVECKPRSDVLDRYYVDVSNDISGEDLKFYDHGNVNIFTQGQQADGVSLGELWISYDITFYNPRVQPTAEDNVIDHFNVQGTGITATNPCGTAVTILPRTGSALGTTISGNLGGGTARLNFPSGSSKGYYLVSYSYTGANSVVNIALSMAAGTSNMSFATILSNGTVTAYSSPFPVGGANNNIQVTFAFYKSDTAAGNITIGSVSNVLPVAGAATNIDIFVMPMGQVISSPSKKKNFTESDIMEMVRRYLRDAPIDREEQKEAIPEFGSLEFDLIKDTK